MKHRCPVLVSAFTTLLAAVACHAQILPPPGSPPPVVKLEYDAQGNPRRTVVAPGVANLTTSRDFDRLHRPFRSVDSRGKSTTFDYNGREDLTRVTDPRGLMTDYARNGLGDVNVLSSPDTGVATQTYDAARNLRTRLDSRGVLATYQYDGLNRRTSVTYTQAGQETQVFSWAYDQTGPGFSFGIGRLTSTQFPSGSSSYAYDAQGRVVATKQSVAGDSESAPVNLTVGYAYDTAGRLTRITYPSGRVLYIPRSGGLPTGLSLANTSTSTPSPLISNLEFEVQPGGAGPARAWQWHLDAGVQPHERLFDTSGRMVRHPLGGALRDISYDAADRIIAYTHLDRTSGSTTAAATALNQGFSYDELGRLLQVNASVGQRGYSYDDNGNRISMQVTSPGGTPSTRQYTVGATNNRLLALDNPLRTLSQDAAGNTWADQQGSAGWTATHDLSGRLTRIRNTADGRRYTTTAYVHDTTGQRVLKKPLGLETCTGTPRFIACQFTAAWGEGVAYVYGPQGQLVGEYSATTGLPLREYVWLDDLPLAIVDGSRGQEAVYYLDTDHLYTPRVAIDRQGRQRWSWIAESFGDSAPVENPLGLGPLVINLRMPGQYFDRESGLNYNWHRSYDARVGRYTQSDPIGLAGGINTYAYVGGNPISRVDPMGLAYFAVRPLQGLPWLGPLSNNPLDNRSNTAIAHEQLFFEDGKLPGNVGFFDDSQRKSEQSPSGYRRLPGQFNDCVMRMAAQAASTGRYNLATNNCQTWADRAREQYEKLMKSGIGPAACGP